MDIILLSNSFNVWVIEFENFILLFSYEIIKYKVTVLLEKFLKLFLLIILIYNITKIIFNIISNI